MQRWSNRELLIADDGSEDARAVLPDDPRIRYLRVGNQTLGAKRNLLCEAAQGPVIAHFDDDDYSAPGRLSDQVPRLLSSGLACTGYHSMRFTDGKSWWIYDGPPNYALGTSLVYRKDWWRLNPFPSVRVGEDNHLVFKARAQRQLITAPAGDLMWATIHNTNTSPRSLKGGRWRQLI